MTIIIDPPTPIGPNPLAHALANVEAVATQLFDSDSRIQSVGVGVDENGGPAYRAVRNIKKIVAFKAEAATHRLSTPYPVVFVDTEQDVVPLLRIPPGGTVVATAGSVLPEQQRHRPICCGLQIQNFDDDQREGVLAQGLMTVGTIGCFVKKNGAGQFILSNNHVVAGENRGVIGDRVLQPGATTFVPSDLVAKLSDFVPLLFSPHGASIAAGNVLFNDVDAGLAEVEPTVAATNTYLPIRTGITTPSAFGAARRNEIVSKVGRTTGLTHGKVTAVGTIVSNVGYGSKEAWFRGSIEISNVAGIAFSAGGDSGSAIVNASGEVIGLLYAGNGSQTYACPVDAIIKALSISL
jgi:S1-C subfamily serine protease